MTSPEPPQRLKVIVEEFVVRNGSKTAEKEISILCVEDAPADVVLINHVLRAGGLNFSLKRVDTQNAFLDALERSPPDVILSDHGMPSFDGTKALAIALERRPEVPFIFVTGSLGEQKTIEMFERGATDYVLKHHLSKLVPAVKRALRESEERRSLQQKEQELLESEERYRNLIERSPEAIFVVQTDDRVAFANPAALKLLGASGQAELVGKPARRIFRPDPWDSLMNRMRRLQDEQAPPTFIEQRLFRLDGTARDAEVSVSPTVFQGNLAMQVIAHDLSESKQVVEQFRQSEALKTAILETALDGIVSINHEGEVQEWNPAAQKIFGYSRDQAMGRRIDDLIIPPSSQNIYKEGLAHYLMTGVGSLIGRPIGLTLRRMDGTEFPADLAISKMAAEGPPQFTALIRDVTDRRKAEAALRESEERFRTLVEGVTDYAIYMLDEEGLVVTWTSGAEQVEGYKTAEILGKPYATFFPPEDVQRGLPAQLLKDAEAVGRVVNEGWRVRKDGSRFWSQGLITALRDENGRFSGFSKIAHDITNQKKAAEEIERLNQELEERVAERTAQLEVANKELEAFSYSVSHDLRAPLRHIAGYVGLLQHEEAARLSETSRRHLQTIASSAQNLGDLIDALLSFSRMGRSEMNRQTVNLAQVVEEAREELKQECQGREIDWEIGPLPVIQGDLVMLRQVVINLVSNAIKYTRTRKRAKIEIGATQSADETTFFIRDNGVGFDMEYANKLFNVFQRLHPASEFEGVGIGLANVWRIVRRHGGEVRVESAINKGAKFSFSIPKHMKGQS